MPKKKPVKKQTLVDKARQNTLHGVLFLVLVLSLVGNLFYYRTLKTNTLVDRTNGGAQAAFSIQPNQACNWQDFEKLSDKFKLEVRKVRPHSLYGGIFEEPPGQPVAQHICAMTTDTNAENESTYVKVQYFLNHDDAKKYSQKELEASKSWSPGTDNDVWRIWSYITIADGGKGKLEKAEAYTVKDDMVIEVDLPCTKLANPGACDDAMRSYVDIILKNIDETYGGENQNPFRDVQNTKY